MKNIMTAEQKAADIVGKWAGPFIEAGRIDFSDAVDLRDAVAAALREVQGEIESCCLVIRDMQEKNLDYCAEVAKLKAEREHFEKLYNQEHELVLSQASIVVEANTECNQLKAERDAANNQAQAWWKAKEKLEEENLQLKAEVGK